MILNPKSHHQAITNLLQRRADNPIVYASDGFISVTGYSRADIIPRNCRFLQGAQTDKLAVRRLAGNIAQGEETVELLLNYRKNGDPFWNLLYVTPLFSKNGDLEFFLGGQVNCSTTIHSCTDILRILSVNDEDISSPGSRDGSVLSKGSTHHSSITGSKPRSAFSKHWRREPEEKVEVLEEAGLEGDLLSKVGRMDFKSQVEAFYTAYSKVNPHPPNPPPPPITF
jgi:PAS domain S-box-containing protein